MTAAPSLRLQVARVADGPGERGEVTIEPMPEGREAAVVTVSTAAGRRLWTRAVPASGGTEGEPAEHSVGLSREQLRFLRPRAGEPVRVDWPDGPPPAAARVVVECLFPVHGSLAVIEQEIGRQWAAQRRVVQTGTLHRVTVLDFPEPMPFRVVSADPSPAQVAKDTRILVRPGSLMPGQAANLVTYDDVGGLGDVVDVLRELVQVPLREPALYEHLGIEIPRGVLLWGPPGTGKTYLARAVANEVGAHFIYVNGPEIVSGVQGGTEANLRRIFDEAMTNNPAVVLIDEIDSLVPIRGESGSQADVRVGSQLLGLLDGLVQVERVVVIGATNRPQAIDPALRRPGRLDREIYIGPPDERGRLEILDIHTRAMPVAADFAGLLPEIAAATAGYSGADLVELVRAAGIHAMRRIAGPGLRDVRGAYHARVTGADFTAALAQTMPSALRETWLRVPGARWSDVVGLEYAIMELRQAVVNPLRFPCLAAELDLGAPSGVLISGPPGSGKSLLARALAAECGANFLPVTGPEIFSQWFGRSEAAIRNLFHLARKVAPTVIVIDPLDGLAQPGAGDGPQARVRDQLLAEFDAMPRDNPVIVVGVTQDPANIDQALLRPGRLGLHVPLTLPTAAERRALLRRHVTERWLESDTDGWSAVLDEVSAITEGWSGADLAGLAEAARRLALSDALNGGRGADGSAGSGAAAVLRPEHLKEASRAAGQRRRPHDHSEERDEQER